jgi:hypothetical protein
MTPGGQEGALIDLNAPSTTLPCACADRVSHSNHEILGIMQQATIPSLVGASPGESLASRPHA